jgi:hypothetical protein
MADPDDTRICVDRVLPDETHPAAAAAHRAVAEAAALAEGTPAAEIDAAGVIPVARLALIRLKMWENGKTLRCRFLDGEATQREKAQAKAQIWEQYANVDFQFVDDGDAEIRISFSADPGSWSAIGTDALVEAYFPKHQPTMNFGWLRADTADEEYERVVVHEFGHALGCIHEHQNPAGGLRWNTDEVYRVFSGPPNYWSKEEIDHNILDHYSQTQTQFTAFDPDSIMLYHFPANLFTDRQGTNENTHLSQTDMTFISQMYPK